jgi:hypothetical protein
VRARSKSWRVTARSRRKHKGPRTPRSSADRLLHDHALTVFDHDDS